MRLILILAAALALPAAAAAQDLPPVGDFPDRPCTLASRMDIYHAPDGTIYECVCEALVAGHVCDWYEQGWAEPLPAARKHRRRIPARTHARSHRVVVHAALPGIVG